MSIGDIYNKKKDLRKAAHYYKMALDCKDLPQKHAAVRRKLAKA